jgi:hypothetical protein
MTSISLNQLSTRRDYWLYKWFEKNNIKAIEDAARVLSDKTSLLKMHEMAHEWWSLPSHNSDSKISLFAGSGLDLSGPLSCSNPECRKGQIDTLFRHAWHYFDIIQLPDSVGFYLLHTDWGTNSEKQFTDLLRRIEVILYLLDIGARPLLHFSKRHPMDKEKKDAFLQSQGFLMDDGITRELVDELIRVGNTQTTITDDKLEFIISDPYLRINSVGHTEHHSDKVSNDDIRNIVLEIIKIHLRVLADDLNSLSKEGGTLGSTVWTHSKVLQQTSNKSTPESVAFNIQLPSLADIPIEQLIRVRLDEQESFHRFRKALHIGLKERLDNNATENSGTLAIQIQNDLIQPELDLITRKLNSARVVLNKKTVTNIGLTLLSTTCGLILGAPAAILGTAVITGLAAATAKSVSSYIEDEKDALLSDTYFIWKALGHYQH